MAVSRLTLTPADRTLLALRGLLVGVTLALAGMEPALRGRLVIVAGVGVVLIVMGLALCRGNQVRFTAGIGLALDGAFALLLYWASGGMAAALFAAGTLPVAAATLTGGWPRGAALALILAGAGGLLATLFPLPAAGSLPEFLFATGALLLVGVLISAATPEPGMPPAAITTHDAQAAREHARVVYEMAAKLNAKLDAGSVVTAILDVGALGLHELDERARLVSAVLLCDRESGRMRVASARRLPAADLEHEVTCRTGVLAHAMRQGAPVISADARNDPELQAFAGFADCRSLVCVPLHSGDSPHGTLIFGSTQPDAFGPDQVALLTTIANQAAIALQNARLFENLVAEKERLLQVEDDARKQLSRELHDGPTQSVAAIAMRVNYIRRLLERQPDQVPPELQRVEELARQTSREIRHMLFTLRPLVLETRGLVPALQELATKLGETYGQQVLVQVQEGVDAVISPDDQNLIFNIVDEAVNNARKHAEAEHIWVRLNRQDRYLILEVQDDGVGFDVGEVDANYDQRGSLGMINLRERAELLGGTLEIESAEGRGTRVTLTVQIDPARLQAADAEAAVSDQLSALS